MEHGPSVASEIRQDPAGRHQGSIKTGRDSARTDLRLGRVRSRLRAPDPRGLRVARRPGGRPGPEVVQVSSLAPALGQIAVLVVALAVAVPLLGRYLAHIYTSERHLAVERVSYRVLRVDPDADQHWRTYAMSVLGFSLVGILLLFGFGRLQQHLPLSLGFPALPADGAWNTAVSFVTNTNWQWYSGEAATGHLIQMSGLTVQNFVSAGVGMAVAAAFARALARNLQDGRIGNFWADLVRDRGPGPAADLAASPRWCWCCSAWCRTSSSRWPCTRSPAGCRTSPAARSPARRRSRSSAPTVAASTTRTPRTRSRTRRRSPTSSRSSCSWSSRSRWPGPSASSSATAARAARSSP